MKRFMIFTAAALAIFTPLAWAAQATMPTPDDPAAFVQDMLAALHTHHYKLLISLVVILLTFVARKYGSKVWAPLANDRGATILAFLMAAATSIGAKLMTGGELWNWQFLIDALGIGLTSIGGYAAVKKMFFSSMPVPTPIKAA